MIAATPITPLSPGHRPRLRPSERGEAPSERASQASGQPRLRGATTPVRATIPQRGSPVWGLVMNETNNAAKPQLVTAEQLARLLGVSTRQVWRREADRWLPPPARRGEAHPPGSGRDRGPRRHARPVGLVPTGRAGGVRAGVQGATGTGVGLAHRSAAGWAEWVGLAVVGTEAPKRVSLTKLAEDHGGLTMSVDHHQMDRRTKPSVDRHLTVPTDGRTTGATKVKRNPPATAPPAKPRVCTCRAYRWPHRPGGGLCRFPDPPLATHPTPASTNRPTGLRRRGTRRWLIRAYKLHPIRDRELIDRVLPILYRWPDLSLEEAVARAAEVRGR
jgi:hypothetical protein